MVNGENSAGGIGITPATTRELFEAGANVITTGNHVWRHKECYPVLDKHPALIRPANYPDNAPGKGFCIVTLPRCVSDGPENSQPEEKIAFINLLGRVFMEAVDCPFRKVDSILATLDPSVTMIVVDMHAEASSEKRVMAKYLDGRVSAVVGTHTHVQTADAMVSPHGTASLTDLGMCGVEHDSVIGMEYPPVVARFLSGLPHPFRPAKGQGGVNGAIIDIHKQTGKATRIALVREQPALLLDSNIL